MTSVAVDEPALDRAPARRVPALMVISFAAIAYGLGLRVWIATGRLGVLNADEVLSGLMARALLDEGSLPTFFWSQSYGGTVELFPFAAMMAVVGDEAAIRWLPVIELVAVLALAYAVARRRLESVHALAVVGLVAVAPAAAVWFSTRAMLFYNPTVILGLVAILLVDQLRDDGRTRIDRSVRVAVAGLALGVGWWTSTQILYFAVPVLYVLIRHRPLRTRREYAIGVMSAVVGAAPWLVYNLANGGASLTDGPPRDGSLVDHVDAQVTRGWPMILGLRRPFDERWLVPGPAALWVLLVIAAAVAVAVVFARHPSLRSPLAGVLPAFAVLHLLAPTGSFVGNGRYYYYVVPALAYVIVASLRCLRWSSVAIALVLVGAAIGTTATLRSMQTVQFGPEDPTELLEALDDRGVTALYTNYWVGYPLAWEDDALVVSPNFAERRPDWSDAVRSAPVAAYVFWLPQSDDARRAEQLIPLLEDVGIADRFDVGGYRVVIPTTNVPPERLGP